MDFAELFDRVFKRLDTRYEPKIIESKHPKTGAKVLGYFKPDGSYQVLSSGDEDPKFPAVTVYDEASLVKYLNHFATNTMTGGHSLLYVNQGGLFGVIDYGTEGDPLMRHERVTFPAAWDEACRPGAEAIMKCIGRWIEFDTFVEMLDKCAPFITNFAAIESATASIEGHESAKITRTSKSYQVQTSGEVACAVEMPKAVAVQLIFMGLLVRAELPLRLTVKDKQVQFYLVDNGAITAAKAEILSNIKRAVSSVLPGLVVIEGTIS